MKGSFIFSGTGNAEGIPVPFCSCPVCSSPKEKERLRSSGILTVEDKVFLMDIGPDLRRQLLTHRIDRIDTAFLTHVHYDHVGGLDDLRAYNLIKFLPVKLALSNFSYQKLMLMKPYLFLKHEGDSFSAMFDLNILDDVLTGEGSAEGVPFRYVTYRQGPFQVNGFRFGDFAYIVDIQKYNPIIKEILKGVKTLVLTVSAKERDPLSMHLSFKEACEFAEDVNTEKLVLTHIGHHTNIDERIRNHGNSDVTVAYDGMVVEIEF